MFYVDKLQACARFSVILLGSFSEQRIFSAGLIADVFLSSTSVFRPQYVFAEAVFSF